MTLKQFFQRLPKDGWWLSDSGEIRRGNDGDLDDIRCQCPVSSLGDLPTCFYLDVAEAEGMSRRMAELIAVVADGEAVSPPEERLYKRLLAHCGLSEPT